MNNSEDVHSAHSLVEEGTNDAIRGTWR